MTPNVLNTAINHCRLIIGEESTTTDSKINDAINKVKLLYNSGEIDEIRL